MNQIIRHILKKYFKTKILVGGENKVGSSDFNFIRVFTRQVNNISDITEKYVQRV